MSIQESFGGRKTFQRTRNNYGAADNKPDVPQPAVIDLREISVFVPRSNSGRSIATVGLAERRPASVVDNLGVVTKGTKIFPQTKQPLTPVFETFRGGGRAGGGGTSKEALRRAKRKIRKSK